jgi:hypothetical protein
VGFDMEIYRIHVGGRGRGRFIRSSRVATPENVRRWRVQESQEINLLNSARRLEAATALDKFMRGIMSYNRLGRSYQGRQKIVFPP